jgi:hypothetical protein
MATIWGRGFGCNVVRGPTRLAAMPPKTRLPALLALAAAVAALSGCGSGNDINGQIPQANADELNAALSGVQAAVASTPPDCATATSNANQFVQVVNGLPAVAGTELKTALRDAGGNLQQLVGEQCPSTGPTGPSGAQPPASSSTTSTTDSTTSSTTDTTTTSTTSSTEQTQPQGNGNGGGNAGGNGHGGGKPGGNGNGGGGADGGTGGTGG